MVFSLMRSNLNISHSKKPAVPQGIHINNFKKCISDGRSVPDANLQRKKTWHKHLNKMSILFAKCFAVHKPLNYIKIG